MLPQLPEARGRGRGTRQRAHARGGGARQKCARARARRSLTARQNEERSGACPATEQDH